jgi:hypothetical protein
VVMAQYERDDRKFIIYINNNNNKNNTNNNLSSIHPAFSPSYLLIPVDLTRESRRLARSQFRHRQFRHHNCFHPGLGCKD